jgi:hypothetical protein
MSGSSEVYTEQLFQRRRPQHLSVSMGCGTTAVDVPLCLQFELDCRPFYVAGFNDHHLISKGLVLPHNHKTPRKLHLPVPQLPDLRAPSE